MQNTTTTVLLQQTCQNNYYTGTTDQPKYITTSACKLRLEDETEKIGPSNNRKVQPESISKS